MRAFHCTLRILLMYKIIYHKYVVEAISVSLKQVGPRTIKHWRFLSQRRQPHVNFTSVERFLNIMFTTMRLRADVILPISPSCLER